MDEKLEPFYDEVLHRNPGETEFHQAVREVLDSLGPVVAKHPEFADITDAATPEIRQGLPD